MNALIQEINDRYPYPSYDEDVLIEDHKRLFRAGGFQRIKIRGETPGFNDGDVCRHSEWVEDELYGESCEPSPEAEEYLEAIRDLGHVRQALYETNYEIVLELQPDGTVTFTNEEYYPEY